MLTIVFFFVQAQQLNSMLDAQEMNQGPNNMNMGGVGGGPINNPGNMGNNMGGGGGPINDGMPIGGPGGNVGPGNCGPIGPNGPQGGPNNQRKNFNQGGGPGNRNFNQGPNNMGNQVCFFMHRICLARCWSCRVANLSFAFYQLCLCVCVSMIARSSAQCIRLTIFDCRETILL